MNTQLQDLDCDINSCLDCIHHWTSKSAQVWSRNFISSAREQQCIKAIIVVGSSIRNVSDNYDVDFIVIYDQQKPKFDTPPLDVDIRTFEQSTVEDLIAKKHDLLIWAIRLGCLVYERNRYWSNLRKRWKNKILLPSAEAASKRADRAKKLYQDLSAVGDLDAAQEQYVNMLTQQARERLLNAGVFPYSRPELPNQLKEICENDLAQKLENALDKRRKAIVQRA
jgi:hypothetical protein